MQNPHCPLPLLPVSTFRPSGEQSEGLGLQPGPAVQTLLAVLGQEPALWVAAACT